MLFCLTVAVITGNSTFASPLPDASEKIVKLFHHDFPEVKQQTFHDEGDSYVIYFKKEAGSSCRVYYDAAGTVTKSVNYYPVSGLNPFIRAKVNARYKGKSIVGITEVVSSEGHFYQIQLQDDQHWFVISATATGDITLEKKFLKV